MNDTNSFLLLFVDPDAEWIRSRATELEGHGIQARGAGDMGKAELVSVLSRGMQIAFVDVGLVEQAPEQFERFTKRKNRRVVVMFSKDFVPYRISHLFKLGAYDCVEKPYDSESLFRLVDSVLGEIYSPANGRVNCLAQDCAAAT